MKLKDVYCGRGGWTKGFMAQGWECEGYDLNEQPHYPAKFHKRDASTLTLEDLMDADFLIASSPCENFSVHCMKHFHKNPPHPVLGLKLFNHTRDLFESSGKPYIMENVRCAERFVGKAVNHCGPFYLWGNAVPAVIPPHIYQVRKGMDMCSSVLLKTASPEERQRMRKANPLIWTSSKSKARQELTAKAAEIPLELSEYTAKCATQLIETYA